jgi:hypothetical protein
MENKDLIEIGFKGYAHYAVQNLVYYSLGRGRYLSAGCVGTPNEILFIEQRETDDNTICDVICLHNFDYDGVLTIEKVKKLIELLNDTIK